MDEGMKERVGVGEVVGQEMPGAGPGGEEAHGFSGSSSTAVTGMATPGR